VGLKEVVAVHQITADSPLQVRDPLHKSDGSYRRRMSDFDIRASVLATIIVLALVLGGSFWFSYVQVFTNTWNGKPIASIVAQASGLRTIFQ
jgi:hypothetical protein